MKRMLAMTLAVLMLCAAPLALADGERTFTVLGIATVTVPADTATVSLGVTTTAADASTAASMNAERVETVRGALKAAGIADEDISTDFYSVYTLNDGQGEDVSYRVSNTMSVTVHDTVRAGEIIDIALGSGANECYGILYTSSQSGAACDDALRAAIREAKRKGDLVAEAGGFKRGGIVTLTEEYGSYGGVQVERGTAGSAAMDANKTVVTPGELTLTSTVRVTFEIE